MIPAPLRWCRLGLFIIAPVIVSCSPTVLELDRYGDTEEIYEDWTVELYLYDYGLHQPLKWAQACIENRADLSCSTSDESGLIQLQAPGGEAFSVVITGEDSDLLPSRVVVRDSEILGSLNVPLLDGSLLSALADAWGYPLLEDRTHIMMRAEANTPDGGLDGVEFWREPTRGQGPYYFDTMAQPNPSANYTNENGYGFLLNGAEGELQLGASHNGEACEANLPQVLSGDEVVSGFAAAKDPFPITIVTFDCDNVR